MALFRHPEHFSIDYMNSLMVKKNPHRTLHHYTEQTVIIYNILPCEFENWAALFSSVIKQPPSFDNDGVSICFICFVVYVVQWTTF